MNPFLSLCGSFESWRCETDSRVTPYFPPQSIILLKRFAQKSPSQLFLRSLLKIILLSDEVKFPFKFKLSVSTNSFLGNNVLFVLVCLRPCNGTMVPWNHFFVSFKYNFIVISPQIILKDPKAHFKPSILFRSLVKSKVTRLITCN